MLDFNRLLRASIPDGQPVQFRNSFLADVQMRKQSDPALDHRERLRNDDGSPPQRRGPMPLLTVVALQGDRVIRCANVEFFVLLCAQLLEEIQGTFSPKRLP